MKAVATMILLAFALAACGPSREEVHAALEKFDSSLDSLINEQPIDTTRYLIFEGDTLKGNPSSIEETFYQRIDSDSFKVDANCHVYHFKHNEITSNASEDILGRKYVQKYIYFNDHIDNALIDSLREKDRGSDTIFFGCLKKYNTQGRLLKMVRSGLWKKVSETTGAITVNDSRIVEVYNYDLETMTYTTTRREFFNTKYNADSLRLVPIKQFTSSLVNKNTDDAEYALTYDNHGNWIVKLRINKEFPEVHYRKISYQDFK